MHGLHKNFLGFPQKGCIQLFRKGIMRITYTNYNQKGHTKRKYPKIIETGNAKYKGKGP